MTNDWLLKAIAHNLNVCLRRSGYAGSHMHWIYRYDIR